MNYTTYLRWGVITGLFATLLIPFVVADGTIMSNLFFPYITGKAFAFRILIEIVAALYIILAIRDPKCRPWPSGAGPSTRGRSRARQPISSLR